MSNRIFRIFNPAAPKQDQAEKRRGQLRRAQKTYRERKDQYARALEKEVARAHAHEADALAQLARLRQTARALAGQLVQHGVPLPADADLDGLDLDRLYSDDAAPSPPRTVASYGLPAHPRQHAHQHSQHSQYHQPVYQPPARQRLRDMDPVVAGMEFVLKIEEPCLDHIACVPGSPHAVNGHALTVSAHLQAVAVPPDSAAAWTEMTTTPETTATPGSPAHCAPPSYEDAPAAVLERLLALAPALVPDGEVTPVQAWGYIRSQAYLGGCAAQSVRTLAERLRDAVTCHGFGAVVSMDTFQALVSETLLASQQ